MSRVCAGSPIFTSLLLIEVGEEKIGTSEGCADFSLKLNYHLFQIIFMNFQSPRRVTISTNR
jgi:hypothetical protein